FYFGTDLVQLAPEWRHRTDAQLDTAIDHLLNKIATQPVPVPEPPAFPNLGFDYGQVTDPSGRGGQRQRR
ncbi:MAG TPA: hypothetical protein VKN76_00410, partial [Kiloniellaceae bacterium]|nr:hypothetical protein [Kiloniellaceae bacterium]